MKFVSKSMHHIKLINELCSIFNPSIGCENLDFSQSGMCYKIGITCLTRKSCFLVLNVPIGGEGGGLRDLKSLKSRFEHLLMESPVC